MSPAVDDVEVLLGRAGATWAAGGVQLDYEVAPRGSRAVWLFTLFETEPSGHYRLAPERAYVELRPPDALVLSKVLWPIPPGVLVELPEVPCVVRLEPGQSAAGRVTVPAPIRASPPYAVRATPARSLEPLRALTLRIGYLPDVPELSLRPGTDVEGRSFVCPEYRQALRLQRVVTAVLPR